MWIELNPITSKQNLSVGHSREQTFLLRACTRIEVLRRNRTENVPPVPRPSSQMDFCFGLWLSAYYYAPIRSYLLISIAKIKKRHCWLLGDDLHNVLVWFCAKLHKELVHLNLSAEFASHWIIFFSSIKSTNNTFSYDFSGRRTGSVILAWEELVWLVSKALRRWR